jgi:hypothetical protein
MYDALTQWLARGAELSVNFAILLSQIFFAASFVLIPRMFSLSRRGREFRTPRGSDYTSEHRVWWHIGISAGASSFFGATANLYRRPPPSPQDRGCRGRGRLASWWRYCALPDSAHSTLAVLSSLLAFRLPGWAVGATGAGAELLA